MLHSKAAHRQYNLLVNTACAQTYLGLVDTAVTLDVVDMMLGGAVCS